MTGKRAQAKRRRKTEGSRVSACRRVKDGTGGRGPGAGRGPLSRAMPAGTPPAPLPGPGGGPARGSGTPRGASERATLLQRIARLESLLNERNEIIQCMGDGLIVFDPQGRVLEVNEAYERMTGRGKEASIGSDGFLQAFQTVTPEELEGVEAAFRQALAGRPIPQIETTLMRPDGRETKVFFTTSFVEGAGGERKSIIAVLKDITERRRMEEELARTRKLESLGVLAGGIAHDFNNLLTPILANTSAAKAYGRLDAETAELLADVERAALRAKALTRQLITFAKGGEPIREPVSLAPAFFRDTVRLALSGSGVRCVTQIPDDLWVVRADPGQISQVLHNLLINADQSMPEGGAIDLRAENTRQEENAWAGCRGGRYVRISVEDQGHGVPKEHLDRIFDPFFTTKERGRGLGLATALSVARRHEGHIQAAPRPGGGTVFELFLPALGGRARVRGEAREAPERGTGRILLVDDDAVIRRSARSLLRRLGYDVETAAEGEEALRLFEQARKAGTPFDLVILDLTIPGGLGGKETMERLRKTDPDVKAIVSSGYSRDSLMADFARYGFQGAIAKPYGIEELSRSVREVLAAGKG